MKYKLCLTLTADGKWTVSGHRQRTKLGKVSVAFDRNFDIESAGGACIRVRY